MSENGAEPVYANGVDATTGNYLLPALSLDEIAALACGETANPDSLGALGKVANAMRPDKLGLPFDVNPLDLSQAGWGLVCAADEDPAVKDALSSLVAQRSAQVGDPARLKLLDYQSGESRQRWLARHGVAAGNIDPTRVPFYLLIVGYPTKIPFGFCRELAVEYAVGLLSFDTPAEYASYAATVVAVERQDIKPRARRLGFFATRHGFDAATQLSADQLVKPLAEGALSSRVKCTFESIRGEAATHEALAGLLTRDDATAPAFLFTASHGMGFPPDHADQRAQQGALLCQDWGGPRAGAITREQYFTAADVPHGANVAGMFAFLFACFGGGTPERDRFAHKPGTPPPALAPAPFAAALPQRLLAHPGGGALGCIAHIDRAWNHSIVQAGAGPQLIPFENAIGSILLGRPIGLALKDFNERYAVLSVSLAGMLEKIEDGAKVNAVELASEWVRRNDAEGYALFGDPAARLQLERAA
jgi:hypothetical protein